MQQRSNRDSMNAHPCAQSIRHWNGDGPTQRAFTLIELLVVIAIIAILAAIIFPAFGAAQENARENNTISHLHNISEGLGLYELDNKSYPPVLFAYACGSVASGIDGCNTSDTMQTIGGDKNAVNELVGLYPEYVSAWQDFEAEDDTLNDPTGAVKTNSDATGPQPNYLCQDGTLQPAIAGGPATGGQVVLPDNAGTCNTPFRSFFEKDAMDIGPQISGANQLYGGAGKYIYVVRYQTAWTSWNGQYDPADLDPSSATPYPADSPWLNYARQLQWQNPPADTYVTAITSHVPNANKLIVLYASGSAIKVQAQLGNPPQGFDDTQDTTSTHNGITPTSESDSYCTYTQPTTSSDQQPCSYVPAQFWGINVTGQ